MRIEHVLIAEPTPHTSAVREILGHDVQVTLGPFTRVELLRRMENVHGMLVRLGHQVDAELIGRAPSLRVIATPTTGLTHIDVEAAASAKVDVLSLRGAHDLLERLPATAELTWGLLLALVRHIPAAARDTAAGAWERDLHWGTELAGKTIGLIGCGRIGRMVARYAQAFGMRVLGHDISPAAHFDGTPVDLETLLRTSDVISMHASFDQGCRPVLGRDEFALIKPGALLVNTARGELLDEDALVGALENGALAGAALDVVWNEPHPSPRLLRLQQTHNVIVTPHIGGATAESIAKTELFIARQLRAHIDRINAAGSA